MEVEKVEGNIESVEVPANGRDWVPVPYTQPKAVEGEILQKPFMTAHELAKKLLEGPDYAVCTSNNEDGDVTATDLDIREVGGLYHCGFYTDDWVRIKDKPYIVIS